MIRVTFWRGRDGHLGGFRVTGHAGYGPKGGDIVCAAVSALAQTAVLSLKDQLEGEPEVIISDGDLQCRLPADLSPAGARTARVILRTLEVGLNTIATDYRPYVRVEYQALANET